MLSQFFAAFAIAVTASTTWAAIIAPGTYTLGNHPDSSLQPPAYGLRLDEMYDATTDHDNFTFDFDHADSAMFLTYDGTIIHIYGTSYGGRDVGNFSDYANDIYRGVYTIDFTYALDVQLAPGDDDLIVKPPVGLYNYGTVQTPFGETVLLRDGHYPDGAPDFRLGDTDDDAGYRGHPGISGWGWLFHKRPGQTSYYPYVAESDWLFIAELIPAPGTVALTLTGLVIAGRRRRH